MNPINDNNKTEHDVEVEFESLENTDNPTDFNSSYTDNNNSASVDTSVYSNTGKTTAKKPDKKRKSAAG